MGEMDYLKKEQESWSKELKVMNKRGKVAFSLLITVGLLLTILVYWVTTNIIRNGGIELEKLANYTPYSGTQIDGIYNRVNNGDLQLPVLVDGKRIYIGESYTNAEIVWEDNLPGICISNAGFGAIICETDDGNILTGYKLGKDGRSLEKMFATQTEADMIVTYFPYMVCSSSKNPGHFYFYKFDGNLLGIVKFAPKTKIMSTRHGLFATDGKSVALYETPLMELKDYIDKATQHNVITIFPKNQNELVKYQSEYIKISMSKEIDQQKLKVIDKLDFANTPTNDDKPGISYFLTDIGGGDLLYYDGAVVYKLSLKNGKIIVKSSISVEGLQEKQYTVESNKHYWDFFLFPAYSGVYKWSYSFDEIVFDKIIDCEGLKVVPGSSLFFSNGEKTYFYNVLKSSNGDKSVAINLKNPLRSNLRKEIFDDKSIYVVRVIDISP